MAYVKIIYQNSPSTATPINAQNLNHMDDGIAENDRRLNELETAGVVNKFNNRTGNVSPEKNDYDISLIGATAGEDGYVPVWRNSGTEEEPNWGFEMEAQGGAGHVLVDSDGNDMPSEDKMQFADAFLSDDDVNGKTVVENIKEHSTKADYDNATEDGFHVIDDGEDAVIHPSSEDYVEVSVPTGQTWTWGQLLNTLWNEIDTDKVVKNASYIAIGDNIYSCTAKSSSNLYFDFSISTSSTIYYQSIELKAPSGYYAWTMTNSGNTPIPLTNENAPSEQKITLYYGNKKAVVDLQTTGSRCLLNDGRTVQEALNKNALSITPSSGITLDNGLFMMNGVVFGVLDISATNNFTQNSWNQIGQISNYSADSADMVMAWDSSNGAYFGTVMIETDGKIKVYPKITTKYCKVRF